MTAATAEPVVPSVSGLTAVKPGDFFCCSWGYDQTNIDFYRVIAVTPSGKSIKVQQWTSTVLRGDGFSEAVVPGSGPVTGAWVRTDEGERYDHDVEAPITLRRLCHYADRPTFTVNSYSYAYLWEGKPERRTDSRAGH
jgi:hypothetical protein